VTAGRPERRTELEANLAVVRGRIEAACQTAGRDLREVTLVVVTKNYPASDVRLLAALGVTDIGENRDQEASVKASDTSDLALTWHFVGRLQSNKCRSVARYAHVVHSVDRHDIIAALAKAVSRAERNLICLLQVSLDGDLTRGGALPEDIPRLADAVAAAEGLDLGGVMAVAPRSGDPAVAFTRLADVAKRLRADHPEATMVSAGMSGDLEQAVAAGATHVRIGTAVLGVRPRLR
jgi:pyridoxal phosphate enzyme (YggS family)